MGTELLFKKFYMQNHNQWFCFRNKCNKLCIEAYEYLFSMNLYTDFSHTHLTEMFKQIEHFSDLNNFQIYLHIIRNIYLKYFPCASSSCSLQIPLFLFCFSLFCYYRCFRLRRQHFSHSLRFVRPSHRRQDIVIGLREHHQITI